MCGTGGLTRPSGCTARLRGDYKTGKRLNMRKIIPYLASDFRRDKIWLRRSKPSNRRYQVRWRDFLGRQRGCGFLCSVFLLLSLSSALPVRACADSR
jgi:hypothetical protein